MNHLNFTRDVYGEPGYSLALVLEFDELEMMRKMIRMQWLYRLQLLRPKEIGIFDKVGIERYHEFSHLVDHADVWPKTSRVLPRESVEIIKKMGFYKKLEKEFGAIVIADEEKLGWENVYWRLVRPGKSDFGTLHADNWFVSLGYYGEEIHDKSMEKIKIWIPIHSTPGKNGLLVVPSSHRNKAWKWHEVIIKGQKKPVIDEDVSKLDVTLLQTEPGRAVIFHYDLLHGGAENLAEKTRVSLEFTFMVKNTSLASCMKCEPGFKKEFSI